MLGMLLVGVSIDLMMIRFGHYYVEGVSYATIQDVLFGRLPGIAFLCLLFILKLALTSLTLGSGASGGIFSPSLFLGATLAAAYGVLLKQLFPSLEISPPAFAVVGMAGIVGGATGAVITSIVMVFEMTRDYYVVVPMTITVAISYGIRKWLCKESIYTMKLARRGHFAPDALQANLHYARRAQEILTGSPAVLSARASLGQSAEALCRAGAPEFYLVDEGGKLAGVLSRERALQALVHSRKDASIAEFADQDFAVMPEDATLFGVIAAMCNRKNAAVLLAVDGKAESVQSVKGLISKENLGGAMIDSVELFMD
jgi:CIC family chloride channel protein